MTPHQPILRGELLNVATDSVFALSLVLQRSGKKRLREWLFVPIGTGSILVVCFGVDVLLNLGGVSFPASVACLLLLFFLLLLSEWLRGTNRTRRIFAVIDVPGGWLLRWMNVFFVPTFVELPLSPGIGAMEVCKLIAVFVFGFIVMMVLTAYMTRMLTLLMKSSKRAQVERVEELGTSEDEILIAGVLLDETQNETASPSQPAEQTEAASTPSPSIVLDSIAPPPRIQTGLSSRPINTLQAPGGLERNVTVSYAQLQQIPLPPLRSQRWAAHITANQDWLTYLVFTMFIGVPVFYATGYAMPLHLGITVLAYFAALRLPPAWRQVLHPVLVSALVTLLTIWITGLTKSKDFDCILKQYQTGRKYLQLWEGATTGSSSGAIAYRYSTYPGAADVLGTILDASIVSLALPMYQYRRELRQHFVAIVAPNVLVSVASLFAYPRLCVAVGIAPTRGLAVTARSLTLALALPAVANLGGDASTGSAMALMSGIVGALIGLRMLAWMRIPEDDYVARGVTLGANSSAIATAVLLKTDPRAAALSSLSMTLFGTVTVLFTSIPPLREVIRSLAGL